MESSHRHTGSKGGSLKEQILLLLKDVGFILDIHTLESQRIERNMVAIGFLI